MGWFVAPLSCCLAFPNEFLFDIALTVSSANVYPTQHIGINPSRSCAILCPWPSQCPDHQHPALPRALAPSPCDCPSAQLPAAAHVHCSQQQPYAQLLAAVILMPSSVHSPALPAPIRHEPSQEPQSTAACTLSIVD
jgi:hypothetical protein